MKSRSITLAILALIALNITLIALAVAGYPAMFSQPGARTYIAEPICALVAYAIAIVSTARIHGARSDTVMRTAALFGVLGGAVEILNIAIENGIPFAVPGPVLPIAAMLAVFTSWGVAAFRTTRSLASVRAGIVTALLSAGICMLVAVAGGFVIEFFLAPPAPAAVLIWGEFTRSGWTDPRAFAVANTLDSAFTHLAIAPIVALLFGGAASLLANRKPNPGSGAV